jgi:topoisomerase-4 subunit B
MNDLFGAQPSPRGKPVPAKARPAGRGTPGEADYNASSIEVLEGLEPVRRRPGMYIGGTDVNALHHLFAEVIDNAMDEAVAGHATFIEVSMEDGGWLSVLDNGRGMPVDPHPKFPKKSALEVIMTMLHAGGKFDSGAYETSGGLHGVGVSVVNALSESLEVEVARGQTLYRQTFERGKPTSGLIVVGKAPNRRGTKVRFLPDPQIFGPAARFDPARVFKMARSKAYLFGGVEIRWRCAPSLIADPDKVPAEAVFHFPGGLKDYLAADIEGEPLVADQAFTGRIEKDGKHGTVEWAIAWLAGADGFVHSYCNTIPTPDGGTHEAGLRSAILRGLKDHAERIGQSKRAGALTADDVMAGCAALISVFIREPEFQGQNKGRLQTAEAARIVDGAIRDAFDHWLAAAPSQAAKLLDWSIERADERMRRRMEKDVARKSAVRKRDCPESSRIAPIRRRRGRNSSSSRATRRAGRPSRPATARPRPSCRCAERSSTSPRRPGTSSRRTSSSATSFRR